MNCLMKIDRGFDLSWEEKLAYLSYRFAEGEQKKCPLYHIFEDGLYIREMQIPAGTLFVGRPHLHGHRVVLMKGRVLWIMEKEKKVMEAPAETMTVPGFQMVALALTDVVSRTYHPNGAECKDVDILEAGIFGSIEERLALGKMVFERIEGELDVSNLLGMGAV